jgi:general secretion pathway protein F
VKKFKIIYQENNKKKYIILTAFSNIDLKENKKYPLNILSIKEIKNKKLFLTKRKISKDEIINLFKEINIILQSGLSFGESIEILQSKYLKKEQAYDILETIIHLLKQGLPVYIGLEKYKNEIGEIVLSFIKLGEENGNIKYAIESLCTVLIKNQKNKKHIISKLNYPILLIISLIIAVIIIFVFVIPKFEYMFTQLGASLPTITSILLQIKIFLFKYTHIIITVISFLLFTIISFYIQSSKFKYNIDKILLLKIPLISKLLLVQQIYRFFLVLKVLMISGYKFQEALSSSKVIINNSFFLTQINTIESYLKKGKDITTAFESVKIFDNLVIRLLFTGEKSNNMKIIMEKLEKIYEEKLQDSITKFSLVIEPLLIAIIGSIILFIMLAIFLPIWQMGTVLK